MQAADGEEEEDPVIHGEWTAISGDDVSLAMDDVDVDLRVRQLAEKVHAARVVEGMHARGEWLL